MSVTVLLIRVPAGSPLRPITLWMNPFLPGHINVVIVVGVIVVVVVVVVLKVIAIAIEVVVVVNDCSSSDSSRSSRNSSSSSYDSSSSTYNILPPVSSILKDESAKSFAVMIPRTSPSSITGKLRIRHWNIISRQCLDESLGEQ